MTEITYWHMQMHPDDNSKNFHKKACEIIENKRLIGLGSWEKGKDTIEKFSKKMKVNDVVAIKSGAKFIALVQVVGGSYEIQNDEEQATEWLIHRRPVRILDWEIDGKKIRECPQPRGTLNRCVDTNADTTKVIKEWHDAVINSFTQRGIGLTV